MCGLGATQNAKWRASTSAWRSALRRAAKSEQRSVGRATQQRGDWRRGEDLRSTDPPGSWVRTGHGTGELVLVLVLPRSRVNGRSQENRTSVTSRERSVFAQRTEAW